MKQVRWIRRRVHGPILIGEDLFQRHKAMSPSWRDVHTFLALRDTTNRRIVPFAIRQAGLAVEVRNGPKRRNKQGVPVLLRISERTPGQTQNIRRHLHACVPILPQPGLQGGTI